VDGVCNADRVDGISNTVRPLGSYGPSDVMCAVEIEVLQGSVIIVRGSRSRGARWLGTREKQRLARFGGDGDRQGARPQPDMFVETPHQTGRRGLVLLPVPRGARTGRAA